LGLSDDLVREWTIRAKKIHEHHCLEDARDYYLNRGKWIPEEWLLSNRDSEWRILCNAGNHDQKEFNMRVILEISCIPYNFWYNLGKVNFEYENLVRKIEPGERNGYFEWAYEEYYHGWGKGELEWVKGFHPGRWILMDNKRGENLEDIIELEEYGAFNEEKFIRSKDHIEDMLNNM